MVRGRYVAQQPLEVRVLCALKTGQGHLITGLGAEVVEPLLRAYEDNDATIVEQARFTLRQLENREAREAVCRLVIEKDHPIAQEAAIQGKYAPSDEYQRALFFFLTEQWDLYEDLDFDQRMLRTTYDAADDVLCQRIRDRMRAAGRTDFLTIVAGGDYRSRVAVMTLSETEFLVKMLAEKAEWAKLWGLVFELPFSWSVRILQILTQNGWIPNAGDERVIFEALISLAVAGTIASEEAIYLLPPAAQRAQARVPGRINDVAFSPLRPVIAIGTSQRKVVLWNFERAERERVLDGFEHSVGHVTFTHNDVLLCAERTNSTSPVCAIYGWRDGRMFSLGQHKGSVTAIEPVGDSRILTAGRDHKVVVWDSERKTKITEQRFSFWARAACVSSDGQRAALLHKGVAFVSLPRLNVLASTSDQFWQSVARCAAFSPDGKRLIVGKFNGEVIVLQRNGSYLRMEKRPLTNHDGRVQAVEVLPTRSVVITAGSEGSVRFMRWANRAHIGSVQVPGKRLTSVHVSPDGSFMAIGDSDASMSLWDLRVLDLPMLFTLPFAQATPSHLAAVSALTGKMNLDTRVRHALQFMECVLRHRFRFDIEIGVVPTIKVGEFDIEIE